MVVAEHHLRTKGYVIFIDSNNKWSFWRWFLYCALLLLALLCQLLFFTLHYNLDEYIKVISDFSSFSSYPTLLLKCNHTNSYQTTEAFWVEEYIINIILLSSCEFKSYKSLCRCLHLKWYEIKTWPLELCRTPITSANCGGY